MKKINFDLVFNPNTGLGDCLSCFNTNRPIWSPSQHFGILSKYSSIPTATNLDGDALIVFALQDQDFGNEHLFNRVRIASGLEPLKQPRATLDLVDYQPVKTNVAFSFDVGSNASSQHEFHSRPRQLYPEHRATVQEFISKNKHKFNFIEVGTYSFGFADTTVQTGVGLDQTINVLRQCQFYFGMHSGLMHLATAIGLKSTIIINFPTMAKLSQIPETFDPNDKLEREKMWLYPQHQYLHEDEVDNSFSITTQNLELTVFEL